MKLNKSRPIKFAICCVLMVLVSIAVVFNTSTMPLPKGWRMATMGDFEGSDQYDIKEREKHPNHLLQTTGDFNGDGLKDSARLLLSDDQVDAAIFITLAKKDHTFIHKQFVTFPKSDILGIYIDNAPPGKYEQTEALSDPVPPVVTKHDGFVYGKMESSGAVVYWDDKEKYFAEIWISD